MALTEEFYNNINNIINQMKLTKEASENVVTKMVEIHDKMVKSHKYYEKKEDIQKVIKPLIASKNKRKK